MARIAGFIEASRLQLQMQMAKLQPSWCWANSIVLERAFAASSFFAGANFNRLPDPEAKMQNVASVYQNGAHLDANNSPELHSSSSFYDRPQMDAPSGQLEAATAIGQVNNAIQR